MSFLAFADQHGLAIRELRDDGRIHRCPTSDKPRSDNGAYAFDGRRGWIQNWAEQSTVIWFDDPHAPKWNDAERAQWCQRQVDNARERAQRAAKAAQEAVNLLGLAELVMPRAAQAWRPGRPAVEAIDAHPYLVRKGFPAEPGLVLDGDLLVAMNPVGDYGRLIGVQRIKPDGDKKFLAGQRAKGAVYRMGSGRAKETWLVEGYVTGLSVRDALRRLYRSADIVVCFSAGNLSHVASIGVGTHIMADNDESKAGEHAAIQTGLPYTMPATVGMDANDVHCAGGIEAVIELVMRRT